MQPTDALLLKRVKQFSNHWDNALQWLCLMVRIKLRDVVAKVSLLWTNVVALKVSLLWTIGSDGDDKVDKCCC